jgi:hypothetical protein
MISMDTRSTTIMANLYSFPRAQPYDLILRIFRGIVKISFLGEWALSNSVVNI